MVAVSEVDRIAALADPASRNLQITECYGELSGAVGERVPSGANWCTFATWASKQAGQTIRQEDLVRTFERLILAPAPLSASLETNGRRLLRSGWLEPHSGLGRLVRHICDPREPFAKAADAVARGNLKVFAEIAREFARFLPLAEDLHQDSGRITDFCEGLRPGDPPNGQVYLQRGFTHYYEAKFEPDPVLRVQRVFLANVQVAYHEQIRLQPEIQEALDVPVVQVQELGERLWPPSWPRFLRGPAKAPMAWLAEVARRLIRHAITECLMSIRLPDGELRLGRDVPASPPESLRQLRLSELQALTSELEPPPGRPDQSAAWDWANFRQRMHYALHLFRSYHENRRLFDLPFPDAQAKVLKAGAMPAGSL